MIIQFPDQVVGNILKDTEKTGLLIKDIFKNMADSLKKSTDRLSDVNAFVYAISTFVESEPIDIITPTNWTQNDFAINFFDEGKAGLMSIGSKFRLQNVPQFGCQKHCEFLKFTFETTTVKPSVLQDIEVDLVQGLSDYYASFPQIDVSNNIVFNYAVLSRLLNFPDIKYVSHGVVDDKYQVVLAEIVEAHQEYRVHTFISDMLPIFLDNAAIEFHLEKTK